MEMTTVSPSPASPTEGDNLCEIDGTNVAIHSVTLLICLFGLVGNGAVFRLLSLAFHNYRIIELAFADFLFLLFTFPAALLFLVEDMSCSPIMPLLYLRLLFQLSVLSCYYVLFRMIFTFSVYYSDFASLLARICRCCVFPPRLLLLISTVRFWAFFALFTVVPAVTNLCPSHQQGHCRAALVSVYALILLLFAAPVVILRTIDFIKAMKGSKKQKYTRRNIVLSLIGLLIFVLILCNFLQQLGYTVSSEIFFLLNCINSSIKPFIYFLAGRCWSPCSLDSFRLSLWRVFDEEKEKAYHTNDIPMDTGV